MWLHVDSQFVAADEWPSTFVPTLGPGAILHFDEVLPANPDPYPVSGNDRLRPSVGFTDSDGYVWQKWADGRFQSQRSVGRYQGRLPQWFMKIPGVAKIEYKWRGRKNRPPTRPERPPYQPPASS